MQPTLIELLEELAGCNESDAEMARVVGFDPGAIAMYKARAARLRAAATRLREEMHHAACVDKWALATLEIVNGGPLPTGDTPAGPPIPEEPPR